MAIQTAFERCLGFTLLPNNDGQGFHDTPGDPGGDTIWGITYSTYEEWCSKHQEEPSLEEFEDFTAETVAPIYGLLFWNPIQGDSLGAGVDLMTFDDGVVGGPGTAAKQLQQALSVNQDGVIGPKTLAAAKLWKPSDLINRLDALGAEAYARGNRLFVDGWENRLSRRHAAALAMASS